MSDTQDQSVVALIEDAAEKEFDILFKLTKDQLTSVNNTFKGSQFEDFVRIDINNDGSIHFALDDMGVQLWTIISTKEINLNGAESGTIYLNKKMIAKILDATKDIVAFEITNEQMIVNISGTELHISLPMQDQYVNTDFESSTEEVKSSEFVSDLCNRLKASKTAGAFKLNTMHLADTVEYGNTMNISLVKDCFKNFDVNVEPRFLEYMEAITFTGTDITFVIDEKNSQIILNSDNVYYKGRILDLQFDDLSELFEDDAEGSIDFDTTDSIKSLSVLSIPLLGIANATFNLSAPEGLDHVNIMVKDEGNRISQDSWKIKKLDGTFEGTLNIDSYLSAVGALTPSIKLVSKGSCVILSDARQDVILIKHFV